MEREKKNGFSALRCAFLFFGHTNVENMRHTISVYSFF